MVETRKNLVHLDRIDAKPHTAGHTAISDQVVNDLLGLIGRDRKAHALRAGRGDLGGIDANDLSILVDERAAGVTGIDRRVHLNQIGIVRDSRTVLTAGSHLAVEA